MKKGEVLNSYIEKLRITPYDAKSNFHLSDFCEVTWVEMFCTDGSAWPCNTPWFNDITFFGSDFYACLFENWTARRAVFTATRFLSSGIKRGNFTNCDFRLAVVEKCVFEDVDFTDADFSLSEFSYCSFKRCKFNHAKFLHAKFLFCHFEDCFGDEEIKKIPEESRFEGAKLHFFEGAPNIPPNPRMPGIRMEPNTQELCSCCNLKF